MTIEEILKPAYPVKVYKNGSVTTRIQTGPDFSVTRSVSFAGREVSLPSPLEMFQRENVTREPLITTSLSPVEHIKAVRKPFSELEDGK